MGMRFESSLGVIRLVQWNAREVALTVRLGLDSLRHRSDSTNRRIVRRPPERQLLTSPPDARPAGQSLKYWKHLAEWGARLHGRHLNSLAALGVALILGYVVGRANTLEQNPLSAAKAEVTEPSPTPEGVPPLAWAHHFNAVQEASWAPLPVEEVSIPKLAVAAVRETRPLSIDEVRETQAWLHAFGFYSGPIDGLVGPQTMAAVKHYRSARKMEELGGLDRAVLKQVRQQSGQ